MNKDGDAKLAAVMLCEEVRREDNGKYLVIGAFTGGPTVNEIPSVIRLAVLAGVQSSAKDADYEFRVEAPGARGEGRAFGQRPDKAIGTIDIVAPFPALIEGPSEISFDWRVAGEGDWQRISWPIQIAPDATRLPEARAEAVRRHFHELAQFSTDASD